MDTTSDNSSIHSFNDLPDELVEQIFILVYYPLPFTSNNHVRLDFNSSYFDYSVQQPLLKQTHVDLCRLSLVCRRFYQIIKSPHFWQKKCQRDHVLLPHQHLPNDFIAYNKLYVNNPFHLSSNLLENQNWRKSRYSMSQIEPVPHGAYRLYDEFHRITPCRATSYTLAKFFQRDIPLPCTGPGSSEVNCLIEH